MNEYIMKPVSFADIEKMGSSFSSAGPGPAAGPSADVAWDRVGALERLGGDEDLLCELCQIFLDESPKLLQKLKEAIANGQSDDVMRAAHSLKGELGYLGATKAVQAARELEGMGHEKDLSRAAEVFAVLDKEFAGLHLTLKRSAGAAS
jgi:two-component system, sensor histidine kinase and response regulator